MDSALRSGLRGRFNSFNVVERLCFFLRVFGCTSYYDVVGSDDNRVELDVGDARDFVVRSYFSQHFIASLLVAVEQDCGDLRRGDGQLLDGE